MKKFIVGLGLVALVVPFVSFAKPVSPAGPGNFTIPYYGMLCRFSATAPNNIGACIFGL